MLECVCDLHESSIEGNVTPPPHTHCCLISSANHTDFSFVGGGRDVADQRCALPHPLPHPGAVELGSAPEPAEDPAELCFGGAAGGRLPAPHSSRAG